MDPKQEEMEIKGMDKLISTIEFIVEISGQMPDLDSLKELRDDIAESDGIKRKYTE